MIELRHITKTYGKKHNQFKALNDINLTIPGGASVAILGKSGSGKSTLMHAISGLDRPQTGQVVIGGRDILQMKPRQVDAFRARTINDSVVSNVMLPLEIAGVPRAQRNAKVNQALEAVGLASKKHNKAKDLSGGQKQRLAIARAIVGEPKILFADEPTGNLDSETGTQIEELLFRQQREHGTTLIIVTHDADLAKQCDYQVVIKDGRVTRHNIPGGH